MSAQQESLWQAPTRGGFLRHEWDVLRVIAATEFKLKYTTSALGYVWSIVKPLSYFAVLWVVFGRFFKLGNVFEQYPLYLLLGIVLWTFFADAANLGMVSLVARGDDAAEAVVPAPRDPDLGDARRGDHVPASTCSSSASSS